MNAVESILNVRTGLMRGSTAERQNASRRINSLRQSNLDKFQKPFDYYRAINTISVNREECRYLLSGSENGSIHIHDLFSSSSNKKERIYNITGKVETGNLHCPLNRVQFLQWFPFDTGMFVSSSSDGPDDGALIVWDTNKMKPINSFGIDSIDIYQHHMSPTASHHNLVAVASSANEVYLWDVRNGTRTNELRSHSSSVLSVKWSPSQEFHLASGSMDNRLIMWDIRAAKSALFSMEKHTGFVQGLNYTRDGLFLVSIGMDNQMHLWNSGSGLNEIVNYGEIPTWTDRTINFDISMDTDPEIIFVPSEENIEMYDLHTGIKRGTLQGHHDNVTCCIYGNFQTLYSVSNEQEIFVWAPHIDDESD